MGIDPLLTLVGEWELTVDLPGAEDVRGHVTFEAMGEALIQRTTVPAPEAPDSCCIVVSADDGTYVQHYFDARGVARLYAMTFDGRTWTLQRTESDFSPLEFLKGVTMTLPSVLTSGAGNGFSFTDTPAAKGTATYTVKYAGDVFNKSGSHSAKVIVH